VEVRNNTLQAICETIAWCLSQSRMNFAAFYS